MEEVITGDTVERLAHRVMVVEERTVAWWGMFYKDVYPLPVPRSKWKQEKRNLGVGDIVLVLFQLKYAKDKYRLGRVLQLHPDHHGLVRVVTVGIRDRQRGTVKRSTLDTVMTSSSLTLQLLPGMPT